MRGTIALLLVLCGFMANAHEAQSDCAKKMARRPYQGYTIILDTNVILNDHTAVFRFPGARIILNGPLIEELDKKDKDSRLAHTVREFNRVIKKLMKKSKPGEGIRLPEGATLVLDTNDYSEELKGKALDRGKMDNLILAQAKAYAKDPQKAAGPVLLVTDDVNLTMKAFADGVPTQEFKYEVNAPAEVDDNQGLLQKVELTDAQMEQFLSAGVLPRETAPQLRPNEFVQFSSPAHPASNWTVARYIYARPVAIFKGDASGKAEYKLENRDFKPETLRVIVNGDRVPSVSEAKDNEGGWSYDKASNTIVFEGTTHLPPPGFKVEIQAQIAEHRLERLKTFAELGLAPIQPKSLAQLMAENLILDDSVKGVILEGLQGSSKTFSGILGAKKLRETLGLQVVVSRPPTPLDDITTGFVPGDFDKKYAVWLQAYYDNIGIIDNLLLRAKGGKNANTPFKPVSSLPDGWKLQPYENVRGRTFLSSVVLVDEFQGTSPLAAEAILSRIGEESKVLILGDLSQIDSRYMNASNNGLAVTIARLTGPEQSDEARSYIGFVKFVRSVRSPFVEMIGNAFKRPHTED